MKIGLDWGGTKLEGTERITNDRNSCCIVNDS